MNSFKQENRKTGNPVEELTERVIGAAIRVHKELGPGFLESVYEEALAVEFAESDIRYERQKPLAILYREHHVGEHRLDFLVENALIVELKAIAALENIHFAILRSYLKAASIDDALLLNFATASLTVKRVGREYTGTRPRPGIHV
jgi:GxxExxY protein